jgi:hypothetical protein
MNGQTRNLKVKNDTFNGTERVASCNCSIDYMLRMHEKLTVDD